MSKPLVGINEPIADFIDEHSASEPGSETGNTKPAGGSPQPRRENASVGGYDFAHAADFVVAGEPERARPGRPRGSRNRTSGIGIAGGGNAGSAAARKDEAAKPLDLSTIESVLVAIHTGVATLASYPEFELSKLESEKYAAAVREVAKHKGIAMDPKTAAYVNLAIIMAGIYLLRIFVFMRERGNKAPAKQPVRPVPGPVAVPDTPRSVPVTPAAKPRSADLGSTPADLFGMMPPIPDTASL